MELLEDDEDKEDFDDVSVEGVVVREVAFVDAGDGKDGIPSNLGCCVALG